MNAFSNDDHPRVGDGTFTKKSQSAPEIGIAATTVSDDTLDQMGPAALSELHYRLVDRLGVVGPTADRAEARYRLLEDPDYYGTDKDRIARLVARAGSEDAFLRQVTDTDAWNAQSEWEDRETERVNDALRKALDELETPPAPAIGDEVTVSGRVGKVIGEDNGTLHVLYGNGDQSLETERTAINQQVSPEDAANKLLIDASIETIRERSTNLTEAEAAALISVERQINDGAWGDVHDGFIVGKIDAEIHGLHDKWLTERIEPLGGLARQGGSDDLLDGRAIARDTAEALASRHLIGNPITPGITQESYDHETRAWRERFGAVHPGDEVRPASWARRPLDPNWVRDED
jgi:hypothetical protein